MTYSETIEWLFEQFPAYHQLGQAAYNPGLKNTNALTAFFGNPEKDLKFIHIGGTNGKGSTANMIASVLSESGQKVGLFTSPHIIDFTERIRINGKPIEPEFIIDFCKQVRSHTWTIEPSFFEITWVMALCYFKQENCTIVIAEVGLGGRLDATNIISPLLSVITNIGLDHTHLLGNTRALIANEKAGIIKQGVPVILGENDLETREVFEKKSIEVNSSILRLIDFKNTPDCIQGYQYINYRIARTALNYLIEIGYQISDETIISGFNNLTKNTGFFGRFDIRGHHPKLIIDCAHNAEGIRLLLNHIHRNENELHILYGTSADKDLDLILCELPKDAHYYITTFKNPRSAELSDLKKRFNGFGKSSQFFHSPEEALQHVQKKAKKNDIILAFGSFFLIHELIPLLETKK